MALTEEQAAAVAAAVQQVTELAGTVQDVLELIRNSSDTGAAAVDIATHNNAADAHSSTIVPKTGGSFSGNISVIKTDGTEAKATLKTDIDLADCTEATSDPVDLASLYFSTGDFSQGGYVQYKQYDRYHTAMGLTCRVPSSSGGNNLTSVLNVFCESGATVPRGARMAMSSTYPATDNSSLIATTKWVNDYSSSSDERLKQQIRAYTDEELDAWGDVNWQAYKFNEAVEAKGAAARYHSGVIAQRVIAAFAAHGLDATRYGLLCYDQYTDYHDADGALVPAHDVYGIRYNEALSFEAAYQRRRADRLEARIAALEKKVG